MDFVCVVPKGPRVKYNFMCSVEGLYDFVPCDVLEN
jgi:hypothetical protein